MSTHLVVCKNRHLFSLSSGGQKSEIKASRGQVHRRRLACISQLLVAPGFPLGSTFPITTFIFMNFLSSSLPLLIKTLIIIIRDYLLENPRSGLLELCYLIKLSISILKGLPGGSVVRSPPANARDTGDLGSIPGSGRSPGEGNGNSLQYSCLENPMAG